MADADAPRSKTRPRPRVVENPLAPRLFAHDAVRLDLHDGVVTMTFAQLEPGPSGPIHQISGRVLLPAVAAQRLAMNLVSFLVKQGLDPTQIVATDA